MTSWALLLTHGAFGQTHRCLYMETSAGQQTGRAFHSVAVPAGVSRLSEFRARFRARSSSCCPVSYETDVLERVACLSLYAAREGRLPVRSAELAHRAPNRPNRMVSLVSTLGWNRSGDSGTVGRQRNRSGGNGNRSPAWPAQKRGLRRPLAPLAERTGIQRYAQ